MGQIGDLHAFGRSPYAGQHAYVVNGATSLFYTQDAGNTWTQITSAPGGGGACGGISFIKAVPGWHLFFSEDLYFSNRCGVALLVAPLNYWTGTLDYSRSWRTLAVDHGDTAI